MRYHFVLLLYSVLSLTFFSGCLFITIETDKKKIDVFNEIMVTLLEKCNLGIKDVIIFDFTYQRSVFKIVPNLQKSMTVSLLTNITTIHVHQKNFDTDKNQGVILKLDNNGNWKNLIYHFFYKLLPSRNYTLFILPEKYSSCTSADEILHATTILSIPAVYCMCSDESQNFFVLTYTSYGMTNAPLWKTISKKLYRGRMMTVYSRPVKNDTTEICKGFNFDRTDKKGVMRVLLGIMNFHVKSENIKKKLHRGQLYDEKVEAGLFPIYKERVHLLKKLLNVKFMYYVPIDDDPNHNAKITFVNTLVDLIIFTEYLMEPNNFMIYSYPIKHDQYAIISYNQGLQTPLEKIEKFYGTCTLVSLIIILIGSFLLIRFKMKKNINTTLFDILRLLINSAIDIPLDNFSVRLFCLMIFIYFLVIHATFSGHLAEFLTKTEFRKNIETIEDLKNSRIETIYNIGYDYYDIKDRQILDTKTVHVNVLHRCPIMMKENPTSVCIGHLGRFVQFRSLSNDFNNTFHISESILGSSPTAVVYRPGFSLRQKFDWALMILDETKLFGYLLNKKKMDRDLKFLRASEMLKVNFRPLKMDDLRFAFVLLIIGSIIGIIFFFLEWLCSKIKLKKTILRNTPFTPCSTLKIFVVPSTK